MPKQESAAHHRAEAAKTSDLTIQERVLQAVNRAYELIAERQAATVALQTAKQAEDTVRLNGKVEAAQKNAASTRDAAVHKADEAYKSIMDVALAELQQAQQQYNLILGKCSLTKGDSERDAQAKYDKIVEQAQQEQNMDMATAHAAIFRGEKEVVAIQTTIDQHKRQVQDNFGIDLSKLVV